MRRPAPPGVGLRQWAEQIGERVSCLLDRSRCWKWTRSASRRCCAAPWPVGHQDNRTYFEVILDGTTSAVVRRFQTAPQADSAAPVRRVQLAFAMTHEGLIKLVSDLVGN